MNNQDLPVADPASFLGEAEVLDTTDLKDKQFIIAINSGARELGKMIAETIHGPYDFLEMVEEVSNMWQEDLHHSKVYVLSKDKTQPAQWLSEIHIDYFEARAADIVTDAFVEGTLGAPTCRAELIDGRTEDPRLQKKEKTDGEETEDQP